MIFAPGTRPDIAALASIGVDPALADLPEFAVSHAPPERHWAEVVVSGMTFDCLGLAPGRPSATPPSGFGVGLPTLPDGEAISIVPGAHLGGSAALLPVLRMQVATGARLARSAGAAALVWRAAGSWIEPGLFANAAGQWLAGGAYPALCLTALVPVAGGGLRTRGLALGTGRELAIGPATGSSDADRARLAVRAIHVLAEGGAGSIGSPFDGPDGRGWLIAQRGSDWALDPADGAGEA